MNRAAIQIKVAVFGFVLLGAGLAAGAWVLHRAVATAGTAIAGLV